MNTFAYLVAQSAVVIFLYVTVCYFYAQYRKRNDFADIGWGLGFVVVTAVTLMSQLNASGLSLSDFSFQNPRGVLISVLVAIWGLRLSTHILLRNQKKAEDFRYQQWRQKWGKHQAFYSFFEVFLLQGFFMWCVTLPIIGALSQEGIEGFPGTVSVLTLIGLLVWVVGFFFESIGDYQLSRFLSEPENKGKIMTSGLWRYTRHPNYFGEVTQWWGIYLAALPFLYWDVTLIGPMTITLLILRVSGVPMLEKRYECNADYEIYKKHTNAFFPGRYKN